MKKIFIYILCASLVPQLINANSLQIYNITDVKCDNDNYCLTQTGTPVTGLIREYYKENGMIQSETNWKDGKKDGKYTSYHEDGNIAIEGNYKSGKKDGTFSYYNKEGSRIQDIDYKDDEIDGKVNKYSDDGTLITTEMYKNNILDGISKYHDIELEYSNGVLEGKYSGECFFEESLYVFRLPKDILFKSDDAYDNSQNKYEKYINSLHNMEKDSEYGATKCNGSFKDGKFSGKMFSDNTKYVDTGRQFEKFEISFKDGIIEGEFDGCLNYDMTKNITNKQILIDPYYDVMCGHGYIMNGMLSGEFDGSGYNSKGKGYNYYYFAKGTFNDGKYTGYISKLDYQKKFNDYYKVYTFRTYKEGKLDGDAFDFSILPDEFDECVTNICRYEEGRKVEQDDSTLCSMKLKIPDLVFKYLQKIGIEGPWLIGPDSILELSNGEFIKR